MTSREIADQTRAILVSMLCKKGCHEESSVSQLVNLGRQGWDASASIARIKGSAWIMRWPECICRECNPLSPTLISDSNSRMLSSQLDHSHIKAGASDQLLSIACQDIATEDFPTPTI